MSLQTRLAALITAIGADMKAVMNSTPPWLPAMSMQGVQVTRTGTVQLPVPLGNWNILNVVARLGTAPTGSSFTVDVRKNGTTIFSGGAGRPVIAASTNVATSGSPSTNTCTTGDYFTVDVVGIGSSTPGSDLVVVLVLARSS